MRRCLFCREPKPEFKDGTCSPYCHSNEYATMIQLNQGRTDSYDGRGREWLTMGDPG